MKTPFTDIIFLHKNFIRMNILQISGSFVENHFTAHLNVHHSLTSSSGSAAVDRLFTPVNLIVSEVHFYSKSNVVGINIQRAERDGGWCLFPERSLSQRL